VGDAQTLETRSKGEEGYDAGDIVFVLITYLNIPNVEVRPSIDEVQNMLNNAGKIIISVTKGVSQWKNIRKKNGKVPGFVPNCDSVKERKLYSAVKTEKPLIDEQQSNFFKAVFRIRIRIHRIHVFFDLPDPDPLVRGMDPDPAPDTDPFYHHAKMIRKTLNPTIL
jgi:hypothetical protein